MFSIKPYPVSLGSRNTWLCGNSLETKEPESPPSSSRNTWLCGNHFFCFSSHFSFVQEIHGCVETISLCNTSIALSHCSRNTWLCGNQNSVRSLFASVSVFKKYMVVWKPSISTIFFFSSFIVQEIHGCVETGKQEYSSFK